MGKKKKGLARKETVKLAIDLLVALATIITAIAQILKD